jgi:hypothetical protein
MSLSMVKSLKSLTNYRINISTRVAMSVQHINGVSMAHQRARANIKAQSKEHDGVIAAYGICERQ